MRAIRLHELVLVDGSNFYEVAYLAANSDVAAAVSAGNLPAGNSITTFMGISARDSCDPRAPSLDSTICARKKWRSCAPSCGSIYPMSNAV
jgi:hypothetical protein